MYQTAAFRQIVPLLYNNPGGSPLGLRHPNSATEINVMPAQDTIVREKCIRTVVENIYT